MLNCSESPSSASRSAFSTTNPSSACRSPNRTSTSDSAARATDKPSAASKLPSASIILARQCDHDLPTCADYLSGCSTDCEGRSKRGGPLARRRNKREIVTIDLVCRLRWRWRCCRCSSGCNVMTCCSIVDQIGPLECDAWHAPLVGSRSRRPTMPCKLRIAGVQWPRAGCTVMSYAGDPLFSSRQPAVDAGSCRLSLSLPVHEVRKGGRCGTHHCRQPPRAPGRRVE
jgi:hypothetical protein